MLTKICLVLAILASAGTIYFTHVEVQKKIDGLNESLTKEKTDKDAALGDAAKTKTALDASQKKEKDTQAKLDQANKETESERKKAGEAQQAATKANEEAVTAKEALETERNNNKEIADLKTTAAAIKKAFADVKSLNTKVDAVSQENKVVVAKSKALEAELDSYRNPYKLPIMTGLKGKVLSVDPKYNFVVIDTGAEKGALLNGELKVSRGGQLIGRLKIVKVEKTYSIANVINPNAKAQVDVLEGDQVLY
jgi:hypothetical protein